MTINQEIVDRYIEHRVFLIRFENRVVRDVLKSLRRGELEALGAIADAYQRALARSEASGVPLTAWGGDGIGFRRKAVKRIRASLGDAFPAARKSLAVALEGVAEDATSLLVAELEQGLPAAVIDELALSRVPERALANMLSDNFGERLEGSSKRLADAFGDIELAAQRRVNKVMRDGVRDGVGLNRMVSQARAAIGTSDTMGVDVARVVRTMVQTTANDAAGMLHRENSDIVRAEQYHATLDSDTCPVCGPLDGKVFPLDKSGASTVPRPPRHPSCRCFVSPVLMDWKQMGLPKDKIPARVRKLLDGKPAQRQTWRNWVDAKPGRLEKILGPSRARLVRSGEAKLSDLSTTTDVLNLDELRQKIRRAA